jgi:MoxR-like ATPase
MISLGYPTVEEELSIVENQRFTHPIHDLKPVATVQEVIELQEAVKQVFVDDLIKQYAVAIVAETRDNDEISLGSSPRGSLALYRGAQAMALIRGREFVLPDDVKALAVPMISHRIIVSAAARMRGIHGRDVIASLVDRVPVPGAQASGWLRR